MSAICSHTDSIKLTELPGRRGLTDCLAIAEEVAPAHVPILRPRLAPSNAQRRLAASRPRRPPENGDACLSLATSFVEQSYCW